MSDFELEENPIHLKYVILAAAVVTITHIALLYSVGRLVWASAAMAPIAGIFLFCLLGFANLRPDIRWHLIAFAVLSHLVAMSYAYFGNLS